MSGKLNLKLFLALSSLLLMAFLSACTSTNQQNFLAVTPEGAFTVDPLFREFYDLLGGSKVLGPAISPMFPFGNHRYQYVQNGCLEYDSSAPESQRFRLAALGREMGIAEPRVRAPDRPDLVYVDGHIIYSGFVQPYRNLGGARFVGKPLTEVHYNPEKLRFEQYFENLGFYWSEKDPVEKVNLLAYGAWKCDSHCRYVPVLNSVVDLPSLKMPPQSQIFREAVARLGSDFTGFVLTDPYEAPDGKIEQIYENIVLVADPNDPGKVNLRATPKLLGILPGPPVPAASMKGFVFWKVSDDLGYNIPQPFMDYITAHGGMDISGPPIGEMIMTNDQVFRQCFTNLCLEYNLNSDVPAPYRIRLSRLGWNYRDLNYRSQKNENFKNSQSLESVNIQVWERYQFIPSDQSEEIGAYVHEGNKALHNIEPILVVSMPDGTQRTYYFPPTGADGKTAVKLEPINASNGTLIQYQVCVNSVTKSLFCVKDSFVIWYNP